MTAASTSEPFLFNPSGPETGIDADRASRSRPRSSTLDRPGQNSPERLIDQARNEISQIVREVASVRPGEIETDRYLRFLADRILRAMAAHGVVIWRSEDEFTRSDRSPVCLHYAPAHRLGTVTDRGMNDAGLTVHDRLLIEIAATNQPVVVPPTPGASESDVPANPSEHPAAIVPIFGDSSKPLPDWMLEVFLEPGGSPASQRGSLRFLAQMGELAGEFLRSDHLRLLSDRVSTLTRCCRATDHLLSLTSTRAVEAATVDAIAKLTGRPRVALCRVDRGHPRIVAVSFVDRIDQQSESAQSIRRAASFPLKPAGRIHVANLNDTPAPEQPTRVNPNGSPTEDHAENHVEDRAEPSTEQNTERRSGTDRRASKTDQPSVAPKYVYCESPQSRWRIVVMDRVEPGRGEPGREPDRETRSDEAKDAVVLDRLMVGLRQAWTAAHRIEAIPGGRLWSRLSAPDHLSPDSADFDVDTDSSTPLLERAVSPFRRRLGLIVAIALTLAIAFFLPIRYVIPTTGVIRPLEMDHYHATSDAVVESIDVEHGQTVRAGDVLVTLASRDLAERLSGLTGRRSILVGRLEQLNQRLAAPGPSARTDVDPRGGDELREEIDSIDRQLEILESARNDLVLRARRDGNVDAWRLKEQLLDRPLRRGDRVLGVIAEPTAWVVDAWVPQERVAHVDRAIRDASFEADVSTRWSPDQRFTAVPERFGPVVPDPVDGQPGVLLRLSISGPPRLGDQPLAETPARLVMDCGNTSVGRFLVEDVIRWFRSKVACYL